MDKLLEYTINSIKNLSQSLKKKGILIEKPWALQDDNGEIQKLIFKKDKGLILSKNGKVTEGKWDYFPEAKSLLLDRGTDKLLLNEEFIDENVLLLKKDGTNNDFFALANENTIPDYNIPKYLNALRCKKQEVFEQKLFNGFTLQIKFAKNYEATELVGKGVEVVDENFNSSSLEDGSYISSDRKITYHLRKGKLYGAQKNLLFDSVDNKSYEIEGGTDFSINLNKRITVNGSTIQGYQRIVDRTGNILNVKNGIISTVSYLGSYELSDGYRVKIEHCKDNKFSKGDKIIYSEPISPIPNGIYRVKGTLWKKIKVANSLIV